MASVLFFIMKPGILRVSSMINYIFWPWFAALHWKVIVPVARKKALSHWLSIRLLWTQHTLGSQQLSEKRPKVVPREYSFLTHKNPWEFSSHCLLSIKYGLVWLVLLRTSYIVKDVGMRNEASPESVRHFICPVIRPVHPSHHGLFTRTGRRKQWSTDATDA
jgi:hypothetical protein